MNHQPVPLDESCSDCGTALEHGHEGERCPICFDLYLGSIDAGFLENYRKFGCRSPRMPRRPLECRSSTVCSTAFGPSPVWRRRVPR